MRFLITIAFLTLTERGTGAVGQRAAVDGTFRRKNHAAGSGGRWLRRLVSKTV